MNRYKKKLVMTEKSIQLLEDSLKNNIFGQDEAIETLVDYVTIDIAGLSEKEKPIGSFLFTGPTGVGKTELAKQLAKELNLDFKRFDMSEYSSNHSADTLIGGAAGLVGYDEGGLLTNTIIENPSCVLLFDEIEKANKTVLNKFLQIMDYGKLTSSKGEEVYFNDTIIIFTSNLGSIKTKKRTAGFDSSTSIEIENDFKEYWSAEFIGRLNQIIEFNPLNIDISKKIIKKYFMQIETLLKNRNIQVSPTDNLIDHIIENSNKKLGARNLENMLTKNIKLIISQQLISGNLNNFSKITFDWDNNNDKYKYSLENNEIQNNISNADQHFFNTVEDAQDYARKNIGTVITRSSNGNGYIVKY